MTVTDATPPPPPPPPVRARSRSARPDWPVIRAVISKDWTAIRRSKPIVIPMIAVPTLLLLVIPIAIGLFARSAEVADIDRVLSQLPGGIADEILSLPQREQMVVLILGYLLAPLILIVPIMVSAVLAADAFAGEKERRTLEGLLHLPAADRDLFIAKVLVAFLPSVAVTWLGFVIYSVVSNVIAWPVMQRIFIPTGTWLVMIFWLAPAVSALALGLLVIVSGRTRTTQEANQLGGAVILPLIFLFIAQASGLLLLPLPVALGLGLLVWIVAGALLVYGAQRFTRDELASMA